MLRWLALALLFSSCLGCQLGYYLHSAYHQSKLIQTRKPIETVLSGSDLTDDQKRKLRLVEDVKLFGESQLGLKSSRNYTTYVKLDEPYVTYIVQVALAEELKPYLWKFPFVGEVPYKGYFKKSMAEDEAASFPKDKYDTFVRGVSAYSTLGWFQDSVLSSMLRYEDYELAEVILHETVHTTLFIKSAAEFNERMATFLGQEGMKIFYRQREGDNSKALAKAEEDSHDQKLFSAFITKEIQDLKKWYLENKGKLTPEIKTARLKEIQTRFASDLKPNLKTNNYRDFEKRELNNAYLLAYQTYEYSLADFQKLFDHFEHDFKQTLAYLKSLEKDPAPDQTLKAFVSKLAR
jgi:predicted aminopeptidase